MKLLAFLNLNKDPKWLFSNSGFGFHFLDFPLKGVAQRRELQHHYQNQRNHQLVVATFDAGNQISLSCARMNQAGLPSELLQWLFRVLQPVSICFSISS